LDWKISAPRRGAPLCCAAMSTVTGFPAAPRPTGGNDAERDAREHFPNQWRVGALVAPIKRPGAFCLSVLGPPCMSFHLRKRTLRGRTYICCGGACPCSGKRGEEKAPDCCLATETLCCFPSSVAVTRFMLQDEQRLANSPTDNCLIATQFALAQIACICSCAACLTGSDELASIANCLVCAADVGWCLLCGCLQAQHFDALEQRDESTSMTPPPVQQMVVPRAPPELQKVPLPQQSNPKGVAE